MPAEPHLPRHRCECGFAEGVVGSSGAERWRVPQELNSVLTETAMPLAARQGLAAILDRG